MIFFPGPETFYQINQIAGPVYQCRKSPEEERVSKVGKRNIISHESTTH